MNHETFFENLELLADAPNGVQKLREMVLSLAVQGKLVPQNSEDESAAVLFEKINLEKDRLLREKKIKNKKQLPLIEPEELPFDLPKSWKWVRLGEVVDYNGALKVSPSKIPDGSWLLELEDIEKNTSKIIKRVLFRVRKSKSTKTKFENGDVLYGKLRPYLNKVVLADEEGFCTTEIIPLHGYFGIFPKYFMYSLKHPDFLKYVNSKTYGINLPRLGTEDARNALFPLPPFKEQKRIVAKVDQLMALCDELEARQQKKHEQRILLNNASLDKLLTAPTPEEFVQHWQRICDNFDLLYDAPETVGQLRQAILQLAVQGKLVQQDPGDEPAAVLLEKVIAKKERMVIEKKIKKTKQIIELEDIPFKIPSNWIVTNLQNITSLITDGEHNTPPRTSTGIPLATAKNIRDGYLDFTTTDFISGEIAEKCWIRCEPNHNDILIVCVGATTGRLCLLKNPPKFAIVRSVALIRPFENLIFPEYVAMAIKSPSGQSQIWDKVKQSAQPCLYINRINSIHIPIPPLEEQKRIVAKVNQLMPLCDELEAGLVQAQTEGGKLMEAVVHHVLAL